MMATEKRLIYLDEAIAKVKDDGVLGEGYSDDERIDDVIDILESCHTVDSVEVVHGRWLKTNVEAGDPFDGNSVYCFDVFACSECGCHFDVSEAMNYCPNCGADMRGYTE